MYEPDVIRHYLPCVWDESYWTNPPRKPMKSSIDPALYREIEPLTGGRLERACEPDTRSGTIDPKSSNASWAELIDIKSAWLKAQLTPKERRALFLAYGLPPRHRWKQKEIAFNQQCHQTTISERLTGALQKMLVVLNGTECHLGEEEAA